MDDQTAPLIRLVPSKTCFSYDLKSATDRWPLVFMFETLALLFDRSFASSVVNTTLGTNLFEVPFVKRALSQVSFVTGQPLGYYGYWPLFAFTHHVLVWWAAEQVRPGILFDRYAILGDDVLITDPLVARGEIRSFDCVLNNRSMSFLFHCLGQNSHMPLIVIISFIASLFARFIVSKGTFSIQSLILYGLLLLGLIFLFRLYSRRLKERFGSPVVNVMYMTLLLLTCLFCNSIRIYLVEFIYIEVLTGFMGAWAVSGSGGEVNPRKCSSIQLGSCERRPSAEQE